MRFNALANMNEWRHGKQKRQFLGFYPALLISIFNRYAKNHAKNENQARSICRIGLRRAIGEWMRVS